MIVLQVLLFRSRWGLRTRAVGEHPKAADTVGIDVFRLRYRNVILGGIFAGLAGAYLTLEATSSFQNGMTAGRGFIALAASDLRPLDADRRLGAARSCLPSPTRSAGRVGLVPPTGELGPSLLGGIPAAGLRRSLPYLVTIIILAGVVGRESRRRPWPPVRQGGARPEPDASRLITGRPRAHPEVIDFQEGRRRRPPPRRRRESRRCCTSRRALAVIGASSSRS